MVEQFKLDLAMELDAVKRYNEAIALAGTKSDAGTREMLEHLLKGEEESVDWHEAQLGMIENDRRRALSRGADEGVARRRPGRGDSASYRPRDRVSESPAAAGSALSIAAR